jgi:putative hydrolase of the HAD superfamily
MIRAVLIDLDGVVRRWDGVTLDPSLGLTHDDVRRAVFEHESAERAVTGAITDEEWRATYTSVLEAAHGTNGRRAAEIFSAPIGTVADDVLEIVRELRKSVPVALVSNATTRLESDLRTLGIADEFDLIVNSSRVGVAKPEPGIYEHAADHLGVALDECLFIDDTSGHVDGAVRLGLRAVLFESPAQLRNVLAQFGLVSFGDAHRHLELLIRPARLVEAGEIAELHLRSAIHGYAGIFPPEAPVPTVDELKHAWRDSLRTRLGLVAVVDTAIVGAALGGPDPIEETSGHLSRLYVSPDRWGFGIGRRLYGAVMGHLGDLGFSEATLWVLERNVRARAWYERLGWIPTGERKSVFEPAGIDDLRYRLSSI